MRILTAQCDNAVDIDIVQSCARAALAVACCCCCLQLPPAVAAFCCCCYAHKTIDSRQRATKKVQTISDFSQRQSDKVAAVAHAHVARLQNHVARQLCSPQNMPSTFVVAAAVAAFFVCLFKFCNDFFKVLFALLFKAAPRNVCGHNLARGDGGGNMLLTDGSQKAGSSGSNTNAKAAATTTISNCCRCRWAAIDS